MRRLLALVALMIGCGSPTELLLVVKAEPGLMLGPGGDVDQLHVQAQPASDSPAEFFYSRYIDLCTAAGTSDCQPTPYVGPDYGGAVTLPVRFYFEPGSQGLSQDIRIWVDGFANGKAVLADGMRFQFSPGKRLWLELVLYRACLGNLTCEQQDLACGVDRDCIMLTTSTSQPGDDLGSSQNDAGLHDGSVHDQASHDLASDDLAGIDLAVGPTDMALPCGEHQAACCPGMPQCNGMLVCTANRCINPTGCGDATQACCPSDLGPPTCNASDTVCLGGTCTACGAQSGQVCCANDACADYLGCFTHEAGMNCSPCGASNQVCCPSTSSLVCGPGLACNGGDGGTGLCQCGFIGGPCCFSKNDAGVDGPGTCPISGMCEPLNPRGRGGSNGAGPSNTNLGCRAE